LTALRSTMSEDRLRLDALTMLQAHRELLPATDGIIDKYTLSGDRLRRMDFTLD